MPNGAVLPIKCLFLVLPFVGVNYKHGSAAVFCGSVLEGGLLCSLLHLLLAAAKEKAENSG